MTETIDPALGVPLALALWAWLGILIAADRRARRRR